MNVLHITVTDSIVVLAGVGGVGMVVPGYRNSWKTIRHHPFIQGQMRFDKVPRHDGKDGLFHEWCWENWKLKCRRMKLDPHLKSIIKPTSEGA